MKIAIVHDWLTGMRGGEKCLEVLCRRFPDARLLTLLHRPGSTSPTIERMAIDTSPLNRLPGVTRYYRYLLPVMPWAVERLAIPPDVDLVVSFSHAVAKSIVPPPGTRHVCYCFTPMRYAWHRRDDYFARADEPWCRGGLPRGRLSDVRNRLLDRLRDWDRRTADRVTEFIAISRNIQRRIRQCYDRPSRVIYPPVDTRFYTPDRLTPRDDFYLHVGALVPYKRVDLVVEACRRSRRRLVIVGDGPERRRLARRVSGDITLLGWQPDDVIRELLRRCRALLFAANEDFGIVPLEAQACGTPVIALGQGGALETVLPATGSRPGTGWLFGQQRAESVIEAIARFERQADRFDAGLARRHAEQFATERFADELIGALEQIAGIDVAPDPLPALVVDV